MHDLGLSSEPVRPCVARVWRASEDAVCKGEESIEGLHLFDHMI